MQREKPVNNEIYHVYNRGVEKRKIFLTENDYLRFLHDLYEFNDTAPAVYFHKKPQHFKSCEVGLRKVAQKRDLLVEIYSFTLMPNHFHLMLKQIREGGVTEFMRKIGTGYTNYFNLTQERVGSLFQGKYKSVRIDNHAHFLHLPFYIHSNPLSLEFSDWQEKGIDADEAIKFLESYKWSSFCDYASKKNFPSVISKDFLTEIIGEPTKFKKEFKKWLDDFDKNKSKIEPYLLEK